MAKAKVVSAALAVLAAPFKALAEAGEAVEATAARLLRSIRAEGITDVAGFDAAYTAACAANGWNTRPGRPAKDRRAIPHTVRTYAWEIRSALRVGIDVGACKSMHDLRMKRQAEKAARTATTSDEAEPFEVPVEVQQDLEGVRVVAPRQPNGALFHDLIAVFLGLPGEQRPLYGRQLSRVMHRYLPAANLAKPAEVKRKAA